MFRETGQTKGTGSKFSKILSVLILCVIFTTATQADSGNPLPANSDQWRFTIAFPMIWAPTLNGKVRGGPDLDF